MTRQNGQTANNEKSDLGSKFWSKETRQAKSKGSQTDDERKWPDRKPWNKWFWKHIVKQRDKTRKEQTQPNIWRDKDLTENRKASVLQGALWRKETGQAKSRGNLIVSETTSTGNSWRKWSSNVHYELKELDMKRVQTSWEMVTADALEISLQNIVQASIRASVSKVSSSLTVLKYVLF